MIRYIKIKEKEERRFYLPSLLTAKCYLPPPERPKWVKHDKNLNAMVSLNINISTLILAKSQIDTNVIFSIL